MPQPPYWGPTKPPARASPLLNLTSSRPRETCCHHPWEAEYLEGGLFGQSYTALEVEVWTSGLISHHHAASFGCHQHYWGKECPLPDEKVTIGQVAAI